MSRAVRVVVALLVLVVVVALLFAVVFPWIDRTFVSDPTLAARAALPAR